MNFRVTNSWLLILFSVFAFSSCKEKKKDIVIPKKDFQESMIKINRSKVQMENEQIDNFVNRYKWPVKKTGTGLRYFVYKEGSGKSPQDNNRVLVDYTITLLNGDTAYSSKSTGPQEFLVSMDNVESGLHEGIKYLKVGDEAKLILPSYLAHGLLGDQKKIPPRTTIIYDIKLLRVL